MASARLLRRFVAVLLAVSVVAAPPKRKSPLEEMQAAIAAARGEAATKVAITRLRRALDAARGGEAALPEALLQEAAEVLERQREAGARLEAAREALRDAVLRADGTETLEAALKKAKDDGLTKGPEVTAAEEALAERAKERKKAQRQKAKRERLRADLARLADSDASAVDAAALSSALAAVTALRTGEDGPLLERARAKLELAEVLALPIPERLERASAAYGREACQQPSDAATLTCRHMSDSGFLQRSRAAGEANCDHPSLRPGGEAPAVKGALPQETSRYFCRFPPPFDLRAAEDGQGYVKTGFEFPQKLFNTTALQNEALPELAVVNLDMGTFRSAIATCGELWLVEFYVHWCPHCMAMMPKLYKLGVALRAAGSRLRIGAVNCAVQRELCGAFQVMGHPLVAFFYPAPPGPDGQVQLFEYGGGDVRVNAALDLLKANRDPAWDAGAPADYSPPRHLFPAEAVLDVIQLLPEEYRPSDAVLQWIGNSSRTSAVACNEARPWRAQGSDPRVGNGTGEAPVEFVGNGWPLYDLALTPAHRLQDAVQAAVYTLEEWVLPSASGPSPHAFAYAELRDLRAWVRLLAAALPGAEEGGPDVAPALAALETQLAERVARIEAEEGRAALCLSEWRALLRPVRRAWDAWRTERPVLPACRTETCRLWMLLHVLSVSRMARLRGAGGEAGARLEAGADGDEPNGAAFDAMVAFLRRYFTCEKCRKHFLLQVSSGAHGLAAARAGGPEALALWWWRLHGAVSERVRQAARCGADRRWPAADACAPCWAEGAAAEGHVAEALLRQYWPRGPDAGAGRAELPAAA